MESKLDRIKKLYGGKHGKPSKSTPKPFVAYTTERHPHKFTQKASKDLMTFQNESVDIIEERNGCVLLADDPGLGKSAQSLSWTQRRPELRPVIIVCPAFLKLNWEEEVKLWVTNPKIQVIDGRYHTGRHIKNPDFIIVNYDILSNEYDSYIDKETDKKKWHEFKFTGWVDYLIGLKPRVVIVDEVHAIKNETFRTWSTLKLIKSAPHKLLISATAFENRPYELYNALNALRPDIFKNKFMFGKRYCGAKQNNFGWEFKGASNTKELHNILTQHVMIRRKKKDVLKDLPPITRRLFPVALSNEKEYRKAEDGFLEWLKAKKDGDKRAKKAAKAEALTRINALEKLAYRGKLTASIEWIDSFLESGEKLVVFAQNVSVVGMLLRRFKDVAVKIDGSMSTKQKQEAKNQFQENPAVRLLIGNIKAAGVGWTFTAASNMALIQYPWSASQLTQVEGRIHRIGQTSDRVTIWYLVAHGTIEGDKLKLINEKQKMLEAVMDGNRDGGMDEDLLDDLYFKEAQTVAEAFAEHLLTA